jgi:Helix-turn-helix domain
MENPSTISRGFKGIWIPAELWLDNRLTPEEKVFIAEIDSLDRGKDHCYASNEYFSDFFQCKERKIQDMLSKLKKLGFVEQVSFDGRNRIIKSNLKTIYTKFSTSDAQEDELYKRNLAPLPNGFVHPSPAGDFIEPDIIDDNKVGKEKEKIQKKEGALPPPSAPPVSFFIYKRVWMPQSKMEALIKDFGKHKIQEMCDELDTYADLNPKKFRSYGCHAAVIRTWILRDAKNAPKTSQNAPGSINFTQESDNRAEAFKLKRENLELFNQRLIDDFNIAYWSFPKENSLPLKIYYNDPKFVELVKHEIRKLREREYGI